MKRNEARKPKSHMVSFRVDEDYLARLDALAQQTSCSRGEVLRRCLAGVQLKSTTIEARTLKRKHAIQRTSIQKTWHPGTWRHFIANRARDRDARAVRLVHRQTRGRDRSQERGNSEAHKAQGDVLIRYFLSRSRRHAEKSIAEDLFS